MHGQKDRTSTLPFGPQANSRQETPRASCSLPESGWTMMLALLLRDRVRLDDAVRPGAGRDDGQHIFFRVDHKFHQRRSRLG